MVDDKQIQQARKNKSSAVKPGRIIASFVFIVIVIFIGVLYNRYFSL